MLSSSRVLELRIAPQFRRKWEGAAGREPYASHPWHLTRASCNRVPGIRLFPFDCPASWSFFTVTSLSCSIFIKQENGIGA
jgi:hypothetical protein